MGIGTSWWRRSAFIAGLAGAVLAIGGMTAVHALVASGSSAPNPLVGGAAGENLPPLSPQTATPNTLPGANVHCGETLTASVVVNTDLNCSAGDALIVGGSNITVNLGGHILYGGAASTVGYGILVTGSHDVVENGYVSAFKPDVVVGNSEGVEPTTNTLTNLHVEDGFGVGILVLASDTTVSNNSVWANASTGIATMWPEHNGVFKNNRIVTNGASMGEDGLLIDYTHDDQVTGNFVNDNGRNGMYLYGFNTTVTGNTADFNGSLGILNQSEFTIDGGGNTAKGNNRAGFGTIGSTPAVEPEECSAIVCT
jgi:hypothetical protein